MKKGAPDGSLKVDSRRWNVVKSVAGASSGDNLAKKDKRGSRSRGDGPLEVSQRRSLTGFWLQQLGLWKVSGESLDTDQYE